MKNYAVIGTGAIGGYCAVKLYQAGFDTHCLFNTDYLFVKEHGLTLITTENKKVIVPIKSYNNIDEIPRCDVILVTLKTTSNIILKNILPKLVHTNTVIVFIQNGIGIEQEHAKYIPSEKIIGGSSKLKVTKISPGIIQHFGFDTVDFAQYYPDDHQSGITEPVRLLAEDFQKAGIDSTPFSHLPSIRWKKLVANIPLSGLSIVFNASTRDLVENSDSYSLVLAMTKEVIHTAKQCGADIPEDFFEQRLNAFEQFKIMPTNYMSMKDDFDAHRPLELQAIYQNAISIAKKYNVTMPLTEKLYKQLLVMTRSPSFPPLNI